MLILWAVKSIRANALMLASMSEGLVLNLQDKDEVVSQ